MLATGTAWSAVQDGPLRIEVITAYNLVVDSNIETPAGVSPWAAHLGVKIRNTGTTPIRNVTARIGDLLNPATFTGTAGVYPDTVIPVGARPYSGTFSFTHEGGLADATRTIPEVPAGGMVSVYWLVSYPLMDAAGKTVAGAGSDPSDDLSLQYDIWVEGYENGVTQRRAYDERTMYCRSQLTAMANKIWPNTTSKVPDAYLDAFEQQLGWRPNATVPRVPPAEIVEGIWYDFGTVRHGFDNNGDLVPDYNAWMQPVGDPSRYDAACFRLVKCYGVVIIKLNDGTEKIIAFEDQLYFENIPDNNTGAVGLVFYEFMTLREGCTAQLSPYQEVASGYDNEKFNGDYGAILSSLQSEEIDISFSKNGPVVTNVGSRITYELAAQNTGDLSIGTPEFGLPLVITDHIPSGLVYVTGSATENNTLPAGVTVTVKYSTDGGTTWSTTEPGSGVNALQWWLAAPLDATETVTVRFRADIPAGYTGVVVKNCGDVSIGGNDPIDEDCATTLITGINSIAGTVFEDDGDGIYFANGIKDAGSAQEVGISNVAVRLYLDLNTNGVVDASDLLVRTIESAANGTYAFNSLPDGRYVVVIDPLDTSVPQYYALTTPSTRYVELDPARTNPAAVAITGQDFGFAPPLSLDKSGGATVYEGQEVTYRLTLKNHLYSAGAAAVTNMYWVPENRIQTVPLSLSPLGTVSTNTGVPNPSMGIYVDRLRNRIYWADQVADRIWMDDLSSATTAGATALISGLTDPGYPAIDHNAPAGKVYLWWSASGKLQRADLGAASPTVEDRYTIISDVSCGVAIDEANRWIYFVSKPRANGKYTIYRQNMDGPANTRDTTWSVELGVNPIYDLVINTDVQRLYFVDQGVGVKFATVSIASQTYATAFNVDNGTAVRGLAVDVPGDRVYFSDSVANTIDAHVLSTGAQLTQLPVSTNPGDIDIEYGAGAGTYDFNTTIATLALRDEYPPEKLAFVRASIPPDSTVPAGTLAWNNLGPLNGGDTINIDVTFRALAQAGNAIVSLVNTAKVTTAVLVNGKPVNQPQDTAPTQILPSGSIAGRIWADTDADGWQPLTGTPSYGYEAGEAGVGGVSVILQIDTNNDGTTDRAITNRTDALGNYFFDALATNVRYRVFVDSTTLPGTGITATGDPDDDVLNAGNGGTGSANNYWNNGAAGWFRLGIDSRKDANNVAQSWDVTNVNFGYTGVDPVIFGLVWLDLNRDGVRDANEPGLSGATLTLSGAATATVTTDANGNYRFLTTGANLPLPYGAGVTYTNTLTPPSGPVWTYTFESPTNAFGVANTLSTYDGKLRFTVTGASETSGSWDIGLIFDGTYRVGDTVYFDLDGDGTQDAGEAGIAGVDVKLYYDSNNSGALDASDYLWSSQVTDASGYYIFTNLANARYFVVLDESDIPAGYRASADPDEPGVVATDGDGMGVATVNGANLLNVDFGYTGQGSGVIGDLVYRDNNGNGVVESGENGIANVTVRLYLDRDANGSYETLLATNVTSATGVYLFQHLPDGNYRVEVVSNDADIPGSLTPSTVTAHTLTLSGGVATVFNGSATSSDRSRDADFGFAPRPSIGDFVFYDANRNGTPDLGETGIPNVTVRLYTDPNGDGDPADGVLLATTNTASGSGAIPAGYYSFPNLSTGGYYLVRVDTTTLPTWNGLPIPQTADPDRDGVPCWDNSIPGLPACDHQDSGIVLGYLPYLGADFGYLPPGVIGDTVWRDLNGDGLQGAGEVGVAGVTVQVTNGAQTFTTTTDGDGHYSFANLADGTWTVSLPASNFLIGAPLYGWAASYDADGGGDNSVQAVITGGIVDSGHNAWAQQADASLDLDFGLKLDGPYAIRGTICIGDTNVLGICDDPDTFEDDALDQDLGPLDEQELPDVTVYLYTGANLLLGSTLTDADGNYAFTGLPNGVYKVVIGTTAPPLDTAYLTTTADVTPATNVQVTASSVIQTVPITDADANDVDFAFISTVEFDFGDLPAAYNATTLSQDGARHVIPAGGATYYLGSTPPDADPDGAPSAYADGDDLLDGNDDEDGVVPVDIGAWTDGVDGGSLLVTTRVPAGQTAYLVGWIDFNNDGSFLGTGELIVSTFVTGTGSPNTDTYTFDIPAGTIGTADQSWMTRFRIFTEVPPFPLFAYTGAATDGEVEDTRLSRTVGGAIGDRVWYDANADGVQQAEEGGIGGQAVVLKLGGVPVATNYTSNGFQDVDGDGVADPVGYYRFAGLAAGTYTVELLDVAAGYSVTYDEDSGTVAPDGSTVVVLGANVQYATADFGLRGAGVLGDRVFQDLNGDGIFQTGEGLAGVDVTVIGDIDGDGLNESVTVTTGSDGYWIVSGLYTSAAGVPYVVSVDTDDLPAGLTLNTVDPDGGGDSTATVSLTSAVPSRLDQDFGYRSPDVFAIRGQVRDDFDLDGQFSDPDRPVGNVVIQLYTDPNGDGDPSDGGLIANTLTSTNGLYAFTNLLNGSYVVVEVDPVYSISTADVYGAPDDNRIAVTLNGADSNGNDFLDAVDPSGYLYDTFDGRIVPGGSIQVSGPGMVTVVQDGSNGQYIFLTDGTPGDYTVSVTPPPGYVIDSRRSPAGASFDPTGGADPTTLGTPEDPINPGYLTDPGATVNPFYYTFSLASGDPIVLNNNYPLTRFDQIGDFVWDDLNADGIQNAGEPGITNVTVQLYDAASNLLAVTSTDAEGRYAFTNLVASTYFVRFTPPAGYVFTTDGAGSDAALDSNAGADGWTTAVNLIYGQPNFGIDAGLYVPAVVRGYAFFDQVSDLVRVHGEDPPVSGKLVWLMRDGVVVATNRTDVNGYYRFTDVRPGTYTVLVDSAPGYLIPVPTEGDAATDPERNRARTTGTSDAYIVHTVQSGDGVITGRFNDPLNAGFNDANPLAAAIDIRALATAGGVAVEFRTIEEAGDNDIVLYVWLNGAWVEVGRAAAHGEGDHLYQFTIAGLDSTQLHDFKIEDDEGYTHYVSNLAADPFAATMVRMERDGIGYTFDSIPDRTYDIYRAASPAGPWGDPIKTVTAEDYLTVVVLPRAPGAASAFFKTVLRGE